MNNDIIVETKEERKKRLARERNRKFHRLHKGKPLDTDVRGYNKLDGMTDEEKAEYKRQKVRENNRKYYERKKLEKQQNNI